MAAFSAPEVAAAFKNIFSNPAYITKYQSNPMVMALVTKTVSKIGGMGGSGGIGYWWARCLEAWEVELGIIKLVCCI